MGKSTGFLEYERINGFVESPAVRLNNFDEFHKRLPLEDQMLQGARCMECGVPFCQGGTMIAGMASGCPLKNLLPEINDLVFHGCFELAYERLSMTNCLPEFTARVCPALCEAACTCGYHGDPVSTKENELCVIEYAFENGLIRSEPQRITTGKSVAVVGSGPSGLAASLLLNKRGHSVTVYERNSRPGGLLRYGIPNMKLDKRIIDRRISSMEACGIKFECGVNVGEHITGEEMLEMYDGIVLAGGATMPRDINVPGRDAQGILFAVDYLSEVTESLMRDNYNTPIFNMVKDKNVIVIGGGDTGNDCVGTVLRQGAASVLQLEMMPALPESRGADNPWPEWPKVSKADYGQEEAIYLQGEDPRIYQTTVTEFLKNEENHICGVKTIKLKQETCQKTGARSMNPVTGSEQELPADIVLIAAGFIGCEKYTAETFGVEINERNGIKTAEGSYMTSVPKVFTAGDMHRGQSLVVWAIREGTEVAREVDKYMMGYSNL